MLIRLVRHARAGRKRDWPGDDDLRPLDPTGHRQAAALARVLENAEPGRLRCSPTVRCRQTLEPLGLAWSAAIDDEPRLAKDAGAAGVLELLRTAEDGDVLCTHGEVMSAVLERLRFGGVEIHESGGNILAKGTYWELWAPKGRVRRLHHVDPLTAGATAR